MYTIKITENTALELNVKGKQSFKLLDTSTDTKSNFHFVELFKPNSFMLDGRIHTGKGRFFHMVGWNKYGKNNHLVPVGDNEPLLLQYLSTYIDELCVL